MPGKKMGDHERPRLGNDIYQHPHLPQVHPVDPADGIPNIKLHPLEPANSPTLSTGYKVGKHRIQGISDEFIPEIVNLKSLDDVVEVDDGDAIIMAQKLAQELGLGVGISSGANFLGALKIQNNLPKDAVIITVFPDDNKKYLSTDLFREEPVKAGFLSPRIKLLEVQAYKRICQTCCNPDECLETELPNIPERICSQGLSDSCKMDTKGS